MPLYEFQCIKCGHITECLANSSSGYKVICSAQVNPLVDPDDVCGGETTKILSRSGIVFQKKYYPNGKDWNETRREAWEKPKSWQQE